MCLPHRTLFCAVFLFVVGVQVETKKSGPYVCPIKFKLVYNRDNGNYVCYKQKEPEEFADKFKNCNGNMYTEILYRSLNISKFDEVDRVWADYKSTYPGGPFVSTSEEKIVYNGTFTPDYDFIYQELCLTVNQFGYYRAVRCDEKYYRYCIVKPYPDTEVAMDKTGCNEFHQSWRFISPRDLCLYNVTGHGGGPVRATWNQSQALCTKNGGSLLSEGIQYANFPMFHKTNESPIPVRSPSKLRQAGINETTGLAITRDFWEIEKINSSVIFFDVICENSVQRRNIFLNLTLESDKILVITNNTVYKRNIHCYTNSETYYPTKVKIHDKKKNISDYNIYKLSPDYDGHYWCVHIDPENLQETESQKLLFLRPKYLFGRYAIKIRLENAYIFENADMIKDNWEERLERYIVYTTKNNIENFENVNITELEKDYIINNDSNMDDNDVISDIKIRRMYIDMRTILFHAQVREDMIPLNPLKLEDADVLFMKPVHICSSRNTVPRLIINKSITLSDCITYKCVGEFDEGVSLVEEATPDCIINTSVAMTGLTIEVRKNEPTSTLPPFEIDDLELTTIQTRLNLRDQASSEEYNDYELTETTYASTTVTEDVSTVTSSTYEYTITETDGVFTPIDSTTTVTTPIEDTTVDTSTEITSTERRPFPPPIIPPLPTTVIPVTTLPSLAPEEQLEQVLNDLDTLLQNDSVQITVEKIEETFDQVNELFDIDQDLQIPGTLLHMLDDLGSKLYLNGSSTGATVRNNIALLVADAAPDNPVRGFRLANTDLDSNFTGDTFQFLAEEINTTHLMANKSEAVVYLPESVTSTPRRLSFVIFRNERAFRCTRNAAIVNSKVVSVNVGNMTTFENGECPCCVTVVGDILMIAEDISKCPCCKVRNKRNICNGKEDSGVIRNRRSITNSSLGIKPHSDIGGMIYAFVNVFREPTNYSEIQLDYLTNVIINAIKFHDQPPADLLYIFDVYSSKVHLNGLKTVINSSHNITFLIADATPEHPIRGFRYIKNTDLNDTKSNYKFLTEESNPEEFLDNDSKVVVLLPESINKSPHRISFIVFEEGLFHENTNSSLTVNSVIVDINIDNVTTFENGECICCPVVFGNVLIYQDDYKCPCCKLKKEMVINYGEHTRVIRNKRELSTDTSEPPDSRTQHLLVLLKELEQYNSTKKYQLFPKLASFAYENRINAASTNNTGLWITLDATYVNNHWLCKITYQNGILEKKSISCGEDINYECMQLLPLQTIVKSEYTNDLKNVINIVNLHHASEDYPTLLAKIFGYDDGNYIDIVQPNTLTIIDGTEINSTCYCCGGTVTCDTMLKCLCCRFSSYDVPEFQRILLRLQQDIINAEELLNEAVLMRNLKDISNYIEYYGISEYSNELLRTLTKLACKLKTGNLWHTDTIAIFSGYPLVNTVDWYWSLHFRTTDSLKFIKGTVSYNMSRVDNDCLKMGPNQRYYKLKGDIERALLVGFIVLRNGIVEKMFYFKENDICSIPYPIQNDSLRYRSEVHWYSSTDKCMCCGENYPSCNMISCSCCLNNNSQIFGDIYNTSAPKRMALESQYENGIANITFPQDVKGKYEIMDQLAKWACENDEQYPIFTEDVIVYKEIAYDVKYTSSHYVCDITYQQGIFDEDSAYCHELGCSYLQPIPLQTTLYSDRSKRRDMNEELNYEYFILVAHLYRNNISDYPNLLLKQFTYVECKNISESNMFSFLSSTQDFSHFYDRCYGNPAFNELNSISGKINLEYLNGVSDYNSVSKYLKEVDLYILDNFEIRIFKYELLRLISRNACQLGPNLGLVLWSTDTVVAFAGYLYADEEYLALDFTTYNITFTRSNITMDCLNMGPYQRLYQFENIAEDVFLVGYIVNHNGKMVELMFYFKNDDCSLPYPVTTRTLTSRSERECAALFSDEVAIQQKYLNHELDKSLETEVPIWKMKKIVREVNSLLDKRDANITEDLLLKLDKLGSKVELKEEVSTSTITDNVAIVISNPALDRPRGIRIAAEKNDTFREDSFSYISGSNYSQYLNSNVSSTVVLLPPSAIDSPSRISFVVFRDNRVFRDLAGDVVVNSRIVSVNIYNYTNFDEGEVIDIYLNPSSVKPGRRISRACGYWKFVENTTGYWATDGCTFHKATIPGHLDFCRCTHLTHFAEILIPRSSFSKTHEVVLEVLSVVGCILSIFGLTIIAVTAGVFDSWRNDFSNKIWLQLCLGIFLINVCFLVTIFAEFEENSIWCIATGITLHYAVLNSFMWMVAAAISSYKKLVLVFSSDISIPKFTVFALIAPLAIIGLLIFLYPHSYSQQFNEKTLSGAFCYPSGYGLLITVYTPILIMLLINWTLFALILNAICKSTNIRKHGSRSRDALRNAVVSSLLIFLFGLPWIAGLTAQFIISAYIFTITASLQGFVLFVFFILANRKTRNLWIRKLNLDKSATVTSTDIYTRSGRSKDSESSSHELKRLTSSDDPAIAPKTRVKVILSPSNA